MCVCAMILREFKSGLLPVISSLFCTIMCVQAILTIIPVLKYFDSLGSKWSVLGAYLPYIMKALGISFIGTLASDLCKESGISGALLGIDLSIKGLHLSLALPLMIEISETITDMISL